MREIDGRHARYEEYAERWKRCRDTLSGSEAVKAAGEAYLPRLPGQDQAGYDAYRMRAVFYGAAGKTLKLYTGLAFSKAPVVSGVAPDDPVMVDADMAGKPFSEVLEDALAQVIGMGRYGILVDYSGEISPGMTKADAARQKSRPYLATYGALDITQWHEGRRDGYTVLDRVVLHEAFETEDGSEGEQFRELMLDESGYAVRIWRKMEKQRRSGKDGRNAGGHLDGPTGGDDSEGTVTGKSGNRRTAGAAERGGEEWAVVSAVRPMMDDAPLNRIPFFFLDPEYGAPEPACPPLLDLVDVNLSHYRTMADLEHGRFFCGLPTPIFAGFAFQEGEAVKLGSMRGIASSLPEAKAYYLEFTGAGLSALESAAKQKEQWMSQLGGSMLDSEKAGIEAAETIRMKRTGSNATLASMAQAVSAVMTKVLKLMLRWAGGNPEGVSVMLLTEYMPAAITPEELSVLLIAVQSGDFRRVDWLARCKVAGILAQDADVGEIVGELGEKADGEKVKSRESAGVTGKIGNEGEGGKKVA